MKREVTVKQGIFLAISILVESVLTAQESIVKLRQEKQRTGFYEKTGETQDTLNESMNALKELGVGTLNEVFKKLVKLFEHYLMKLIEQLGNN